jgi:hypothetical protein
MHKRARLERRVKIQVNLAGRGNTQNSETQMIHFWLVSGAFSFGGPE